MLLQGSTMRCRSGRATHRMGIDTSNGAHRPRLQSPAAKARTRDSTATVSRPRATVYFGRKVPSCHRMAFYDRFPAQLPSEMAVKCQDASAWHFTAIPLRARDPRTRAPAPLHPCTPPHLHIGSSTRVARGVDTGYSTPYGSRDRKGETMAHTPIEREEPPRERTCLLYTSPSPRD